MSDGEVANLATRVKTLLPAIGANLMLGPRRRDEHADTINPIPSLIGFSRADAAVEP